MWECMDWRKAGKFYDRISVIYTILFLMKSQVNPQNGLDEPQQCAESWKDFFMKSAIGLKAI